MSLIEKLRLSRLCRDQRGLTTVEYVILLAMVAVVAVASWKTFGSNIATYLQKSSDKVNSNVATDFGGQGKSAPTAQAANGG